MIPITSNRRAKAGRRGEENAGGEEPDGLSDDEKTVYDFSRELLKKNDLTDAIYDAALARFGQAVWMRVIRAIKELLDQQPPGRASPYTEHSYTENQGLPYRSKQQHSAVLRSNRV